MGVVDLIAEGMSNEVIGMRPRTEMLTSSIWLRRGTLP